MFLEPPNEKSLERPTEVTVAAVEFPRLFANETIIIPGGLEGNLKLLGRGRFACARPAGKGDIEWPWWSAHGDPTIA